LTYIEDTTTYALKMAINEKSPSRSIEDYSNLRSCFLVLSIPQHTFQTIMDMIFRNEIVSGDVIIYMDNILIAKVAYILQKLKDNNLFLKPEKCQFHKKEVEYLGIIVGKGQVKMHPIKVQGITDWPVPTNLHELHSFLGFENYYKDFIQGYSFITHPLHDLTRKNIPYIWSNVQ
jgi:hypothetical protein